METSQSHYDCIIVGAGVHGLCAAHTFLSIDPSISLLILDEKSSLGGVWAKPQLYPGLRANNLQGYYEFTDFPILDAGVGVTKRGLLSGEALSAYVCKYAEHFDLTRRVRLETRVLRAINSDLNAEEIWVLQIRNVGNAEGEVESITCTKLIIATGQASQPHTPTFLGVEKFKKPIIHAASLAEASMSLLLQPTIKHVTVLGGSKSAHDAVYLCATTGKKVTWVIRKNGRGVMPMAKLFAPMGPWNIWLEGLLMARPSTWFGACPWSDGDGFGWIRWLLHGTKTGRRLVKGYFTKTGSDALEQTGILKDEKTKILIPDQGGMWYGVQTSALNYDTDFYELIRNGQVEVIREDLSHLDGGEIFLQNEQKIETDVLICATGYKYGPSFPLEPVQNLSAWGVPIPPTNDKIFPALDVKADVELFKRFPVLEESPKQQEFQAGLSPWRLWRFLAPPSQVCSKSRSLVFLCAVASLQTMTKCELTSLWAYAYLNDALAANPDSEEDVLYESALWSRFGKWKVPMGGQGKVADFFLDSMPYYDLLLRDLGLRNVPAAWEGARGIVTHTAKQPLFLVLGLCKEFWFENRFVGSRMDIGPINSGIQRLPEKLGTTMALLTFIPFGLLKQRKIPTHGSQKTGAPESQTYHFDEEPTEHLELISLGDCNTVMYWPSVGSIIVATKLSSVELDFLKLPRFESVQRSYNATEEDEFCRQLRKLGGKWCRNHGDCLMATQGLGRPTTVEEKEALLLGWPPGIWRIKNAHTMEERRKAMEIVGATYYKNLEDCEFVKPLLDRFASYSEEDNIFPNRPHWLENGIDFVPARNNPAVCWCPTEAPPEENLCEVCKEIRLRHLIFCEADGRMVDLDNLEVIMKRTDCDLCTLIALACKQTLGEKDRFGRAFGTQTRCHITPHDVSKQQIRGYPLQISVDWQWIEFEVFYKGKDAAAKSNKSRKKYLEIHPKVDVGFLKQMLHACEETHDQCNDNIRSRTPEEMCVIDLELLSIVPALENCRYCALSYVWGKVTEEWLTLTRENAALLRNKDSLLKAHLPRTIKDAMQLSRDLGERFLWADSLCIVQNDPAFQKQQIDIMDEIYATAAFTIIAAAGDHADAGLPGVGSWLREAQRHIITIQDVEVSNVIPCLAVTAERSIWNTRGWTYQERMFSRRAIILTEAQAFFACSRGVEYELKNRLLPNYGVERFRNISSHPPLMAAYAKSVEEYSLRSLTNQADILRAFHGIANHLSRKSGSPFFYGLPSWDFEAALLWQPSKEAVPRKASEVVLPTWSWASTQGAINYSFTERITTRQTDVPIPAFLPEGEEPEFFPIKWLLNIDGTNLILVKDSTSGIGNSQENRSSTTATTISNPPPETLTQLSLQEQGRLLFSTQHAHLLLKNSVPFVTNDTWWTDYTDGINFSHISIASIYHLNLASNNGDEPIGFIELDKKWAQKHLPTSADKQEWKFVALSLAAMDKDDFMHRHFTMRRNFGYPLVLSRNVRELIVNVMLVRQRGDVARRLGVGKIYLDCWENSRPKTEWMILE
ncbi:hypothetical protein G7Y89_g10764 [Cudoniella acicularis]|uniref:Heterokaryon incompatibility domain-containing protein n=1 Tax=Cudoniella acicularis TaxID=354080 RepID=A0A8H4W0M2_9HELO|nr:hypothetical protein G7Y89_g10764 [Cudoniella acicularis]